MKSKKSTIWEKNFSNNFKPSFWIKILKRFEKYREDVIISLLPKKGNSIVDLACGDGELLFKIADRFNNLIGLDIARNRITNAGKKAVRIKNVKFIFRVADLDEGIPLNSGSADIVICQSAISYFYDTEYFISEVVRVLKRGGIFILETPNYAFLTRRISLLFGNLPKTSSFLGYGDGGALHYFAYATLRDVLNKNGFKVIRETNSGILPSLRRIWPELLAGDIIMKAIKK